MINPYDDNRIIIDTKYGKQYTIIHGTKFSCVDTYFVMTNNKVMFEHYNLLHCIARIVKDLRNNICVEEV